MIDLISSHWIKLLTRQCLAVCTTHRVSDRLLYFYTATVLYIIAVGQKLCMSKTVTLRKLKTKTYDQNGYKVVIIHSLKHLLILDLLL